MLQVRARSERRKLRLPEIRADRYSQVKIGYNDYTEEEVPKWQYQREKSPSRDVIKDVQQFGSLTHLRSASVLTAVNLLHLTEYARIAVFIRA